MSSSTAVTVSLFPWPVAAAQRLVEGVAPEPGDRATWHPDYPLPDTVDALSMLLASHSAMGTLSLLPRWWVHRIHLDGQVVGDVGFHGPPAAEGPVVVELGYAVVPAVRGRGVASAAVAQLLELAWRDGAEQVVAGTEEDNGPSQGVLRRAGFQRRLAGDWALRRPGAR